MSCDINIIYLGTDLKNQQIGFTDDDGDAIDLTLYDQITLKVVDEFGNPYASYIYPWLEQDGYHELRIQPDINTLQFDIFKADSANFRLGDLFVNAVFFTNDDTFTDGYQEEINNILIAEVKQ